MGTNVGKKNNSKSKLANVSGEITPEEQKQFEAFFSYGGMKKGFLDQYPGYTRRQLDYCISDGKVKHGMLLDIRSFIEENKDVIAAFLRDNQEKEEEQ